MLRKGIIAAAGGGARDLFFANVSLLLRMDGTNGSNQFIDSSLNNLSMQVLGSAQISNSIVKFGSGAGLFGVLSNRISTSTTTISALGLGTGNFTIEMWIYKNTAITNWNGVFELGTGSAPYQNGLLLRIQPTTDSFYIANVAYNWSPSVNFTLNQWNHLALVRNGNLFTIYVNGNSVFSVTRSVNLGSTAGIWIGGSGHSTTQGLGGYMDEFRLTKGVARYTGNFSPPTKPF